MYQAVLCHHGILGQRWGVRRFQNKDGSLTEAGKKHYTDQYTKEMKKYEADSRKNRQRLNMAAYNKTADEYNAYKIAEYNSKHKPTDPDYVENYYKQFEHDYHTNYDNMLLSELKNNKHYKKAEALVNKYKDLTATEIVTKNRAFVNDLENALKSGKTSWDMDMSKYKQGG